MFFCCFFFKRNFSTKLFVNICSYVVVASLSIIKWKYGIKSTRKILKNWKIYKNWTCSRIFYLGMLKIISILISNEYFHMTKCICARPVQTVCNITPKTWSQILGPGSGFLFLSLRFRSWILVPGSWIMDSRFQVPGLGSSFIH